MELRQLRYFLVLAEELHFKKAAAKLFIVQPALTKQIQELEKALGVRLFNRTKRSVQLTEAGQFLKSEANEIIHSLAKIKNNIHLVVNGEIGELRIGYVGSCMHTFLPSLLSKLHTAFPKVQTYLSEMNSASQFEALQKGELDIAFLRNPPPGTDLGSQLIFKETFSLILPEAHYLTPRKFKAIHQVANEWFILPTKQDGELYHRLLWSICEDAGFTPRIAHETVHGYTTLSLVENNLGISLIPTSFRKVSHHAVKFIELKNILQHAEITALWNLHNPNPVLGKFLQIMNQNNKG